ncbi:hypothetical protein ACHHV8_25600 [Paenibacillus sp. TAB 01]|uniref:hypothetical protein n=1 Tax=Paenibacillus sp. TAB 01 TaxID=3368988 RepID=UPI003752CF0C
MSIKCFESVTEAVRHLKSNLPEDIHEAVFLMYYEDRDSFFVSDDTDDLEKQIDEDFYSWGYDGDNPEEHAAKYKIWSYVQNENKDKWPVLYRDYKRTSLSKQHLRGKANAAGEVIASFSVSKY